MTDDLEAARRATAAAQGEAAASAEKQAHFAQQLRNQVSVLHRRPFRFEGVSKAFRRRPLHTGLAFHAVLVSGVWAGGAAGASSRAQSRSRPPSRCRCRNRVRR
jgi:hypothetical protein